MSAFKNKKIIHLLLLSIIFVLFFSVFSQTKAQSLNPYWLEYKDSSSVHVIQGPFLSQGLCDTWWSENNNLSHFPPWVLVKACFSSATTPVVTQEPVIPPTCTLPQILDTTTNTCITPAPTVNTDTTYTPLAPLPFMETTGCIDANGKPCIDTQKSASNPCPFGNYLNIMIKIFLGVCAVLAMVMIVMGGIEYMTSDLASSKEAGKKTITQAILGLLLALGAFLILKTINPELLNVCLNNLPTASITIQPLYDRGASDPKNANGESIRCTPVTTPNSPCTVANLTPIFGAENAVAMSKICNMESGGTSIQSGTDICKPSNDAFSFGLFQVNLSANGILAGSDCVGLFDKAVRGSDAIEPKYNSGFNCKLLPGKEAIYNTCKNRLLDPTTNLAIAKSLFLNAKGIHNWDGDKKYCASAFN